MYKALFLLILAQTSPLLCMEAALDKTEDRVGIPDKAIIAFQSTDGKTFPLNKRYVPTRLMGKIDERCFTCKQDASLCNYKYTYVVKTPFSAKLLEIAIMVVTCHYIVHHHGQDLEQQAVLFSKILNAKKIDFSQISFDEANKLIDILTFFELPEFLVKAISDVLCKSFGVRPLGHLSVLLGVAHMPTLQSVTLGDLEARSYYYKPVESDRKAKHTKVAQQVNRQLEPTEQYKREIALNLLNYSQPYTLQEGVLDEQTWKDLELVCGRNEANKYLAAKIDRTKTTLGKVMLFRNLANCTADLSKLQARRNLLEVLKRESTIIEPAFDELKDTESGMYSFWEERDFFEVELDDCLYRLCGLDRKSSSIKAFCDWLNQSPTALEISERYDLLFNMLYGSWVDVQDTAKWLKRVYVIITNHGLPLIVSRASLGMLNLSTDTVEAVLKETKKTNKALKSIERVLESKFIKTAYVRIAMLQRLKRLADYFDAVDTLRKALIKVNSKGDFDNFIQALDLDKYPLPIRNLRQLLQTDTFKNQVKKLEESFSVKDLKILFCFTGRILTAFNIMRLHKASLIPLFSALGELDALMSSVRLLQETEGKPVTYCFPTFVKDPTPRLIIQDGWNPMIDPDKVKTNSLALGGPNNARIVTLTGANGGGKSTIAEGLTVTAETMALGMGIVAAKSCTLTPAHCIRTYRNITDEREKHSLAQAALARCREIQLAAQALPAPKTAVVFLDEIANGTDAEKGEAYALTYLEEFVKNDRVLCVCTTHFKKLPRLLQDRYKDIVANYQVKVVMDANEKIIDKPHLLEPGISIQSNVLSVAQDVGFGDDFIKQAQANLDVLKNMNP